MSKRERHLKQRLDELFSSPDEAAETPPVVSAAEVDTQPLSATRPIEPAAAAPAELPYLKTAIDRLPLPAYLKDREHTWVAANAAFAQLLGYRPENLVGHTDKEQADEAWQSDDHVLDSGQPEETQETTHLPDGTIRTRRVRRVPLASTGQTANYVMGVVEENIVSAPAPAQPQAATTADESMFRDLFENSDALIQGVTNDGAFVFTNRAWREALGYSEEDLAQLNLFDVIHPDDQPHCMALFQRIMEGEHVQHIEARFVARDGHTIDVEGSTSCSFKDGRPVITRGIFHDVSERKRLEQDLQRLLTIESKRAVQLQTAAEVSKAAGTILEVDELLPAVVNLIQQRFQLYYVGLFLVDEGWKYAVLRAGTGEAGRNMLERGHQLAIDERSMIGWCVFHRRARVALDVSQDTVRFGNPLLPDTRAELALPLISRGQILGAMTVQSADTAAFSEQDVSILQTMSDQIATAIANAQLFERTRRHSDELALINRVVTATASSFDLNYILDVIAAELTQALALGHVGIALLNEARTAMTLVADRPIGPDGSSGVGIVLPLAGNPSTQQVIATQRPMVIPDAQTSPLTASIHAILRQRGTQSLMILPIVVHNEVFGTVGLDILQPGRVFTADETRLAELLVAQASKLVENVHLFEQTRQNSRELAALNELGQAVSQQIEIEQVLEVTYQRLRLLAPVDAFFAALYDRDSNTISFPVVYDEGRRYAESPAPFNPNSRTGKVILTGESILTLLTAAELAALAEVEGALGNVSKPSASLLYVPLQVGARMIGSLSIQSYRLNAYTTDTVQLMSNVANQVAIAIQNARLLEEAQTRARREQTLREITARVRSSTDADAIVRTAIRELGLALGRETFIRLGDAAQLSEPPQTGQELPVSGNGHQAGLSGGQQDVSATG